MKEYSYSIHYVLRFACAMCFIGHGAFGIITKPVWCNYFAVFGIEAPIAYQLMPVVGVVDIALGIILLVYPLRIVAAWLIFWGLFTAALRPLSGEPFAEMIERAGNFGTPFVLLLLSTPATSPRDWFRKISPVQIHDDRQRDLVITCMRVFSFLILCGHGWLNVIEKQGLVDQYLRFGFANPSSTATIVGVFEIAAALIILVKPVRELVLILFLWKMAIELFYPVHEIFEWVERGGSYAMLLGLWMALKKEQKIVVPSN
jgi:uncharacterized membrane protein YphA (DoxX/SURF4 family)